MPRPVRTLAALAALGVICGCAQTGRLSGPLAAFRKPADEKKAEQESAPFKPASATAKAEPEKTPEKKPVEKTETAATSAPTEKPPAAKPEDKPVVAEAAAEGTAKEPDGTVHDAETLALIEEEIRQAPPSERSKLYDEFKSLDGEMVRQLVRINRMVRDLESSKAATAVATAAGAPAAPLGETARGDLGGHPPSGTETGSRVLPLGGNAVASIPSGAIPIDGAESVIQPAGHSVAMAPPATRAAAIGHSTTRPVQVLDALSGGIGVAANGPPAAPTAEPVQTPSSPSQDAWTSQLRQLIAVAEGRAEQARIGFLDRVPDGPAPTDAARKAYVESQVQLRLLYLMAGEQARAVQAIPGLDAADQEFWQQVLWGVSNYFDEAALPNQADRATQTVEQLRTAVTRLQSEANLSLRNVAFCHKITSFGSYEKFERDEYEPGQPVLLYAEVANFKSMPQPSDGLYKTQLKSTVEFYRAGEGRPVHQVPFEPTTDLCRSYRQDYFHSYELKIPTGLTLGPHVLKLTVEDMQTGKLATYSLNFTVK